MSKTLHHVSAAMMFLAIVMLVGSQQDEYGYQLFWDFHGLAMLMGGCFVAAIVHLTLAVVRAGE